MNLRNLIFFVLLILPLGFCVSCGVVEEFAAKDNNAPDNGWNFGKDVSFLKKYTDAFVLGENDSYIVIVPEYQARVMTSTCTGPLGNSFGWINRQIVAFGKSIDSPYIGGEDFLSLLPEGGQFGLFYENESSLEDSQAWKIPSALQEIPFKLISKSKTSAVLENQFSLKNAKGASFDILARREIRLLNNSQVSRFFRNSVPENVKFVAYGSLTSLTNKGSSSWEKQKGLIAIRGVSNFKSAQNAISVLPLKIKLDKDSQEDININLQEVLSTNTVQDKDGVLLAIEGTNVFYKTDGLSSGSIGLTQQNSKGLMVTYEPTRNLLTVVKTILPKELATYLTTDKQKTDYPYDGDMVSLENNPSSLEQNPFYSFSTSSPALDLEPNQTQHHMRYIFHFYGSQYDLSKITQELLSIDINQLMQSL